MIGVDLNVTVQINLFGGSVANLGNDQQREWLEGIFKRGELGSFLLTERGAGVLSGLIVVTEARFNKSRQEFDLHSPAPVEVSAKYWISQGYTARWGVVIAKLLLEDGTDKGAHAFIVDLHSTGVFRKDMPKKTCFNSLDNCEIWFDHVALPRTALLSGISFVDANGDYQLVDPKVPFSFYRVAQRLLSGRIALSCCALSRIQTTVSQVEKFAAGRNMPVMGSKGLTTPLLQLPSLQAALARFYSQVHVLDAYLDFLRAQFSDDRVSLDPTLVHQIACAKILVIDFALRTLADLKGRVGAYSLMFDGAFDLRHTEIYYLIRFAEGDCGILLQKMARDALRPVSSPLGLLRSICTLPIAFVKSCFASTNSLTQSHFAQQRDTTLLALKLLGVSGPKLTSSWLNNHALIEKIAERFAFITIHECVSSRSSKRNLDIPLQFFAQLINSRFQE